MIREKDQTSFIRNFLINDSIDFFLGSGASLLAGIASGQNLVWEFKKEIYCSENQVSKELFKDLQSECSRIQLQEYFDSQSKYPPSGASDEYSFYFEKCYDNTLSRKSYIQKLVSNIAPTRGHLCLANLILNKEVNNVWTTNFDELIEAGIKTISPEASFNVLSSNQGENINEIIDNSFANIIKLHGDYRYDNIKNTNTELQELEKQLSKLFIQNLTRNGLVIIGYAGNDESIMKLLEDNINNKEFLNKGIYWCKPKTSDLSERVNAFMKKACELNELSCVINIDEFLNLIYQNDEHKNRIIDERWKDFDNRKKEINFSSAKSAQSMLKTNTYISRELPMCNIFDTDIKNWRELRNIIADNGVVAGLFNNKVYSFCHNDILKDVFNIHIKSEITKEFPSKVELNKPNFVYIGMLYDLIRTSFLKLSNIAEFSKNKYYFLNSEEIYYSKNNYKYKKYFAFEIQLSYYNEKFYLSLIPTIHLTNCRGETVDKLYKQIEINKIMSNIHNAQYNDILKNLNLAFYIKGSNELNFSVGNFSLKFNQVCLSYKMSGKPEHPQVSAFKYDEPEMLFNINNQTHKSINQLKGLQKYAPIDSSFDANSKPPVKLAVLSPTQHLDSIIEHLNNLNSRYSPINTKEMFMPNYEGFYEIYKRVITIPIKSNSQLCRTYDEFSSITLATGDFTKRIKSQIDYFQTQNSNFDILIIYIPKSFEKFREDKDYDPDFNLHDEIKLYATKKGVRIQFIEEKSIMASDKCKVMWALSTSLYAKASGVLWHPVVLDEQTAFVGISYAKSNSKGICIGCSQLFDSTGTGIRLILKKIDDPQYIGKNPYMKQDEARTTISKLREEYYKCDPVGKLRRIVIHKTTPFTKEEIIGFTEALEGIEDIELLQIQGYSPYRAVKFYIKEGKLMPNMFPIERGTTIKLSEDSFLLWTHGIVEGQDLSNGRYNNYYKGGRGIPIPVLVKRFYGKAPGDTIVNEILMLTKMNWNSGDNLYKNLPVTLDFAKTLSRMSKQKEALYDKSYDFRYFM